MKKIFLILCVVMQCLGMQAQLGTTLYGGLLYNIYDDGTAECLGPDILDGLEQDIDFWEHYDENVIAYRAGLESAEIYEYVPYYDTDWEGNYQYVGEFLVTSIGDGAFRGCTNMTSVSIPWSVTTIGNYAFSSGNWGSEELGACSSLTSIDLSNVTSIGAGAFDGCTSLQTVYMPSEFNFDIQREIKEFTFRNCESLEAITIPYGCTTIAESAFDGCKSLQQVYFAENNTNPSNDRFLLETIGPRAFRYCESLQSFDFSMLNHLSFIGGGSFGGCKKLASVHFLNRFYTFEYAVFSECENLSSVTLPSTMTSIQQYFFEKCTSLTSIDLPVIEEIGIGAFQESGLKSISLPPSLKSIGGYAFCGCTGLTSITLPRLLDNIGNRAFYGCKGMEGSLVIPASVQTIGAEAFYNTYFSQISFEEGSNLTNIANSSFGRSSIATTATFDLVIPASVKTIGTSAFHGCPLSSITFNEGLETIGDYSFMSTPIEEITLSQSVTKIACGPFKDCENLKKVTVKWEDPEDVDLGNTSQYDPNHRLPWLNPFDNVDVSACSLVVPKGTVEKYKEADVWKDFYIVEGDGEAPIVGDVNGDGVITIADVTAMVNIILGKTGTGEFSLTAADVNGDGVVTIADVTALVNKILGKETE